MIIQSLYRYQHNEVSKSRWDLVETLGASCQELDCLTDKVGRRFVYMSLPNNVEANFGRVPTARLCGRTHLTSLFLFDIKANLYYGDRSGAAYLVQVEKEILTILVAPGQKQNCTGLATLFLEGEFTEEISSLVSSWKAPDLP